MFTSKTVELNVAIQNLWNIAQDDLQTFSTKLFDKIEKQCDKFEIMSN